MSIRIKCYPAGNGESFLIKLQGKESTNILIDTGYKSTAEYIINDLDNIKNNGEKLDLFVLTHIDNDHINGARDVLRYIIDNDIELGEIWYNEYLCIQNLIDEFIDGCVEVEDEKLDRLASMEYPKESTFSAREEVGIYQATCLIDYLMNDKIKNKWNKSFDDKCVYKNKYNSRIKINEDVVISIIGPNKDNLKSLYEEWKTYLDENMDNYTKSKNLIVAKAFEKYMILNNKSSLKSIVKSKCSSLELLDMINYEDFDKGTINRSSISIIIEFNDRKLLFLGDSSPREMEKEIIDYSRKNGNRFEVCKVSHHGSRNNISKNMIESIECRKYLISTNGGTHSHPDIESIIKILQLGNGNKTIYFNYKPKHIINMLNALGKLNENQIRYLNEDKFENQTLILDL